MAKPTAKKPITPARVAPPPTPAPTAVGTLSREDIEAREARDLAPYAMRCVLSKGRAHEEPEHAFRTCYMRDRDRVIHASAFRRLEYKTQVFVNHEGDYYRTRLTHTMEVAQVARTAARALRLNEDLTEAIGLSHDVGHGPFGHAGETALKESMKEHGGFEHNAHGLRVVDILERRYAGFRGLNLSYEVREAFAMHSPNDKASMGFERRRPLLEAQLVDLCDNLTYTAHDLDDGIAAGCVQPEQLRGAELWRDVWDRVVVEHPDLPQALRVSTTVKRIIDACVGDLLAETSKRIAESGVATPAHVQDYPRLLVGFSPAMGKRQRELARFLYEHFYRHSRLVRMGRKARKILTAIFDTYASEPQMLDEAGRVWAAEVGVPRAICDKIAAMTDREAMDEYRRLFLPTERD